MGVDLTQVSMTELWILVFKRCVYLIAKLISFKGIAFTVCCLFLTNGVISGAVWCSLTLGIIANRTGKQIIGSMGKGDLVEERVSEAQSPASCKTASTACDASRRSSALRARDAETAKERIRDILAGNL